MDSIKSMVDLQKIDSKLDKLNNNIQKINEELANKNKLNIAQNKINHSTSKLSEIEKFRRQSENKLSDISQKSSSIEKQLYDGSVSNPKELEAIENSLGFLNQEKTVEENKLLKIMLLQDEFNKKLKEDSTTIDKIKTQMRLKKEKFSKIKSETEVEISKLIAKKDTVETKIQKNHLSKYQLLRETKNGLAIVKVEKNTCQGCRIALTTAELQKIIQLKDLIQCKMCNRILYVS